MNERQDEKIPQEVPSDGNIEKTKGDSFFFFQTKKRKILFFSLIAVFLTALILTLLLIFLPGKEKPDVTEEDGGDEIRTEDLVPVVMDDEMRGVYIASVLNLNFPSKPGLDEETLKKELDDIVAITRDTGFDTVFFQVRPAGDALYSSEIFPGSRYLVEKEGEEISFDPLAYLIEKASEYGMDVVAWVNPYRVTAFSSETKEEALLQLSEENPARKNPDLTVFYGGKLYYDPALPEVRELIADGVREICEGYDVKGILYDDYFYPYPVSGEEFDDTLSYQRYGGGKPLDDWRRSNVNQMVQMTFDTVKDVSEELTFGVSPFGIWQNVSSDPSGSDTRGMEAYSTLYCDAVAWINGGYIDYVAPQIYWERGNSAADFATLARWWSAKVDGTRVKLCISHAAYKVSEFSEQAGEITHQISYARSLMGSCGSIQYGFADIRQNTDGLREALKAFYEEPFEEEPNVSVTGLSFARPVNGLKTTTSAQFVSVSSDPRYPVYSESGKVGRTKNGFFSYRMPLTLGENTLTFTQNGIPYTLTVIRTAPTEEEKLSGFEILSVSPSDAEGILVASAASFPVTVEAPAGAKVTVSLGGQTASLSPTLYDKAESRNLKESYQGTFSVSEITYGSDYVSLGRFRVVVQKGNKKAEKEGSEVFVIPSDLPLSATVVRDYAYLKKAPDSSFYDDFTPASVGMCDGVTGYFNGCYRLTFGGFVAKDDVVTEQKRPASPVITGINSFADEKESGVLLTLGGAPPITGDIFGNVVEIRLFGTDPGSIKGISPAKGDRLFHSIELKKNEKEGSISLLFTLKDPLNYYGFDYSYDKGTVRIAFRQPQRLSENSEKPLAGKTIVIDAGHGGSDPGAFGFLSSVNEKDLNLGIALALEKRLTELGAAVVMSRPEDSTVTLRERMDLLTATDPDFSVSVHHNSIDEAKDANSVGGTLGLFWSESGALLAETVQQAVAERLAVPSLGAQQQELALCRNHRFPQTLVEVSFICSPIEFERALRQDYSKTCADAIAKGILSWYERQAQYLSEV